MKIGILIPTIYRPDGLRRSLNTLIDTTKHIKEHEIIPVIAAEQDDYKAVEISQEYNVLLALCGDRLQGPAYAWNTALEALPDCDAYFTGSDDIEFTDGWLDEVLLILKDELHGSGLVGINDGRWNRAKVMQMCATHYLMTRDFIVNEMGGVAAQPFYHADFTDMEACARARHAGKFAWAEKALVIHRWGGPMGDLGYKRATEQRPRMKPLYEERKRLGFPNNFKPILTNDMVQLDWSGKRIKTKDGWFYL